MHLRRLGILKPGFVGFERLKIECDGVVNSEHDLSFKLPVLAKDVIEVLRQPKVVLGVPENTYRPDFLIVPAGSLPYYVDVKSEATTKLTAFRKNVRLWKSYGRLNLHIIVRINGSDRFHTTEIIEVLRGL